MSFQFSFSIAGQFEQISSQSSDLVPEIEIQNLKLLLTVGTNTRLVFEKNVRSKFL